MTVDWSTSALPRTTIYLSSMLVLLQRFKVCVKSDFPGKRKMMMKTGNTDHECSCSCGEMRILQLKKHTEQVM